MLVYVRHAFWCALASNITSFGGKSTRQLFWPFFFLFRQIRRQFVQGEEKSPVLLFYYTKLNANSLVKRLRKMLFKQEVVTRFHGRCIMKGNLSCYLPPILYYINALCLSTRRSFHIVSSSLSLASISVIALSLEICHLAKCFHFNISDDVVFVSGAGIKASDSKVTHDTYLSLLQLNGFFFPQPQGRV